jgi:hypothetical protein
MVLGSMEENAYLILGCHGRTENGFVLCPGVQNRILKLDDSLVSFDDVVEYLDIVKLFDRPMLDQNSIHHLVYNLQDRFDQKIKRLWTDHEYHLIERFMHMHKQCGLYARLLMIIEGEQPQKHDNISFIKGTPEIMKIEGRKPLPAVGRMALRAKACPRG